MKQITIQGFAHCSPSYSWRKDDSNVINGFAYDFCNIQLEGDGYIPVGTATLTIDLPEGFDPRSGAVKTLEEQRKKIQAEFQARMNEIDKQISQYTAIAG